MELLRDKLFNGISFEIIKEKYEDKFSSSFGLLLRVTNFSNKGKKIECRIDYISTKYGLKKGWTPGEFIPDNTFFDFTHSYEGIDQAYDGDRIDLEVNEGKFASLRLIRKNGQWWIVESKERSSYNRSLKRKIEHFEAIEEQLGITIQNFSVKVRDVNSLDLFCEVLALNGKVKERTFSSIEAAIYDSDNEIVYHARLISSDFRGFEVFYFGPIRLDISVDEISKIRVYPTR